MPEIATYELIGKYRPGAETRVSAFLDSIASYARSGSWIVTGKFGSFRRLPDIRSTYDQTFSIAFLRMYPLITTKERLAIWEKARGLWKGRVPEPIREPKKINYSDIPELSDRQRSSMRRVGRPTAGDEPRKLILNVWTQRFWDGCARWLKKEVCPLNRS